MTAGRGAGEPKLAGFPCRLGDVVVRASGEEAWLAGALLLSDRAPLAVLFVAPDAGCDRALLVRPAPSGELVWLGPVSAASLGLGAEPPASVEQGGDRFDRVRRLPVRVERLGSGAPDIGPTAIFAEYKSLSAVRLVVLCGARPIALRGTVLAPGMYSVLGAGSAQP